MNSKNGLHEGMNQPSPVSRVLALGFYDGPTEGILQLRDSGEVFRFQMLDSRTAEGSEEEIRVFGLHPLPGDSLDRIAGLLGPFQPPRWPVWCPVWKFPSEEVKGAIDREIETILEQMGPLTWVIAADPIFRTVRALPVEIPLPAVA